MKYSALMIIAIFAAPSQAFLAATKISSNKPVLFVSEENDYDAPIDRAVSVGNVVRAPMKVMGVEVPGFLAKAFNMGSEEEHFRVGNNIVDEIADDECYLGKDGMLDECADFDPLP